MGWSKMVGELKKSGPIFSNLFTNGLDECMVAYRHIHVLQKYMYTYIT